MKKGTEGKADDIKRPSVSSAGGLGFFMYKLAVILAAAIPAGDEK